MLRIMFALVLPLAACDWTQPDTNGRPSTEFPDAPSCDIGAFEIAVPREGLHYDKSLDVLVDETELWASLTLKIGDDVGDSYIPTADSSAPYPRDAGSWWNLDTFHFELAANTRYTLTVSHCTTSQSVSFFTSP
jgi:hypothetical protein